MSDFPPVTFGMIVLNGQPFLRYNLRSLYPFAHEIIVVEGASPAAKNIATPQGHSTDGTLDALRDFKAFEDTDDKLTIITAEDEGHPDGFWPGEKHEMSQVYAKRATGDYLWQVDVDEFYKPEDMHSVLEMLHSDLEITAVSFKMITFWGSFDYLTDGWYLRRGANTYHRLFKWGAGYEYVTHRPPTVHNELGQDLRDLHWANGEQLSKKGIKLYHYSLLFPKQVMEKCDYYGVAKWARRERAKQWAQDSFMRLKTPFRVHNIYDYPSWLERFTGSHPEQIEQMRADIVAGRLEIDMRSKEDVEQLLCSNRYKLGRTWLKLLSPLDRYWTITFQQMKSWIKEIIFSEVS